MNRRGRIEPLIDPVGQSAFPLSALKHRTCTVSTALRHIIYEMVGAGLYTRPKTL